MARKMNQSKVLDCLNDIYTNTQQVNKVSPTDFIRKYNLGTYILPVLIEAGILKKVKKGYYVWKSIQPNIYMVEKVIEKTQEKNAFALKKRFLDEDQVNNQQIENWTSWNLLEEVIEQDSEKQEPIEISDTDKKHIEYNHLVGWEDQNQKIDDLYKGYEITNLKQEIKDLQNKLNISEQYIMKNSKKTKEFNLLWGLLKIKF